MVLGVWITSSHHGFGAPLDTPGVSSGQMDSHRQLQRLRLCSLLLSAVTLCFGTGCYTAAGVSVLLRRSIGTNSRASWPI
jgi:hypothetical protein